MYDRLPRLASVGDEVQQHVQSAETEQAGYGNAALLEDMRRGPLGDVAQYLFPDTVYLGVNDPVIDDELAALPSWAAVCDGSEKRGTVRSVDGKSDLSIEKPEDVAKFLQDAGVAHARQKADGSTESPEEVQARVDTLQGVMMSAGLGTRDQLAEMVQTMQKVEKGEIDMERLVISGHHGAWTPNIYGPQGGITYDQLKGVMNQFPGARDGVKDLMLSSCNTIKGPGHDKLYQEIFPNLETTWGYDGKAPSAGTDPKNSSPIHIEAWERASRGDDEQAVVDAAKDKINAKVATY